MPAAIPLVAAAAGAYATTAAVGTITLGVLGTGLFSAGVGIAAGSVLAGLAGFAVTTAINAVGSRLVGSKPKAGGATSAQDARGQSVMVRSSVESHKVVYGETRVSGPIVFVATTGSGPGSAGTTVTGDNVFLHLVIALAGHEVDSIPTVYLNDLAVTLNAGGFVQTAPYLKDGKSYVRVVTHTGTPTQTADPLLSAEYPGWDANHRLRGIPYVYVRMQWNPDVYPNGTPNVSAVVRGKKVYDPRSGVTAWSANAALCARDYLTSDYGFHCDADEINDDYWEAAASVCDESVTLSGGGTQKRYTVNGVLDTAATPLDNLNALVASMAGAVTYVQGQFRGYAGAYDAAVGDITLDMVVDGFDVAVGASRSESFNRVQGTYLDPTKNWQPTDFPPVTNAYYETLDGGEAIAKDVVLTLTNHPEAAQRIAKVLLEQGRQGLQLDLKLNHKALQFAVWDVVRFTNPALGWDAKPFRIKSLQADGVGAFTVSLQEESAASYEWAGGEALTYDPAPNTNLPNPFVVPVPVGVSFNSRAVSTTGGDTVYNLVLTWAPTTDAFVRDGGQYEIQYKLSSETDWRPSFYVAGSQTAADILSSSPNVSYDLRLRAIRPLGPAKSAWVTIAGAIIGSSGGAGFTDDWGSVADAVGTTNDWGSVADPVGATNDWGSVV